MVFIFDDDQQTVVTRHMCEKKSQENKYWNMCSLFGMAQVFEIHFLNVDKR